MDAPRLVDSHAHTEFAYCASGVTADEVIARSRMLGLAGVCLVEHAPQLYCAADDFWVGRHVARPEVWRGGAQARMGAFRQAMLPRRSAFVRVGLEVELDADGCLTLRDEDRAWPAPLVGAVHFLPEDFRTLSAADLASGFMRSTLGLLEAGVDILAHPWRLFRWAERTTPADLFPTVAQALADTRTAAEINFHGNEPVPAFLAACLERGVKIAFGSDAHAMHEVGAFGPHLALLRRLAGTDDVADLLLYP
jgi:histidinol phosphatase-like PHP family hydrolase